MRDNRHRALSRRLINGEEWQKMVFQKLICSLGHRLLAFDVDEACVILVFIAMQFASCLLRVGGASLERLAFVVPKVLHLSAHERQMHHVGAIYLFDQGRDLHDFWHC